METIKKIKKEKKRTQHTICPQTQKTLTLPIPKSTTYRLSVFAFWLLLLGIPALQLSAALPLPVYAPPSNRLHGVPHGTRALAPLSLHISKYASAAFTNTSFESCRFAGMGSHDSLEAWRRVADALNSHAPVVVEMVSMDVIVDVLSEEFEEGKVCRICVPRT